MVRSDVLRPAVVGVLGAAVVAVTLVLASGSGADDGTGGDQTLSVVLKQATNVIPGQEVHIAGQRVGKVESTDVLDRGRAVRVVLELADEAWPLPKGTKFAVRWGGTVSYNNRYVQVTRGRGPGVLRDGEQLPASSFTVPVEIDDVLGDLGPEQRADIEALLDRGGVTLKAAGPHLGRALDAAPPALEQASAVTSDLAEADAQLDALVTTGDRVVDAVHRADPGVGTLIEGGSRTLAALAAESIALKGTLSAAAPTLRQARATLRSADPTLQDVGRLTTRVRPGIAEVRATLPALTNVLRRVRQATPDAKATLSTVTSRAPAVTQLLKTAAPRLPQVTSVLDQAQESLRCIRPWTPDITAFFSTWSDFMSSRDGKDKYFRAQVQTLLPAPSNAVKQTSGELADTYPGLRYAFPMPPGYAAGQPWLLPECGAGADALDPRKDPEAKPVSQQELLPPNGGRR